MNDDVTVIIPHIPVRAAHLRQALASVTAQTLPAHAVSVAVDRHHDGAVVTRNRALYAASTTRVAFLDDDDFLHENHLRELVDCAHTTGADVVYPGCVVVDAAGVEIPPQPQWGRFGELFDPGLLRRVSYIPVTSLVRTELAHAVGGFAYPPGSRYEDWGFYLRLLDAGARFVHLPVRTWTWRHWGYGTKDQPGNTSGDPTRW